MSVSIETTSLYKGNLNAGDKKDILNAKEISTDLITSDLNQKRLTQKDDENQNENGITTSYGVSYIREFAGKIVEHPKFVVGMIILILINAVMMGVATFPFVKDDLEVSQIFETVDLTILIIFTVEISLNFTYLGFGIFCDGWLFFDFCVVALSWIMAGFGNDSVKIFRSFRIFRALRLIKKVKTLRDLVNAIISVIPRMGAIFFLLGIFFYIFGVMFTLLFKDAGEFIDLGDNYFGGLHNTLFTLFQIMTMDNWVDITRELMTYKSWAWAPFCAFVFITGFIVVNLLIAVICDAVYELNDFADALTGQLKSETDDSSTESPSDRFSQRRILQRNVFELKDQVQMLIDDQKSTMQALMVLTEELSEYDDSFKTEGEESCSSLSYKRFLDEELSYE